MPDMTAAKQALIGRAQTGWARTGARVETELASTGPEDTGNMNRNTRVFPRGPLAFEVVIAADYASFVRDGTRPHEIVPVTAQALRWTDEGGTHFAKRVQHPGTQPNDWYEQATGKRIEFFADELGRLP